METLIGLVLLVAVIWVVRVAFSGAGGTDGGSRGHTPDGAGSGGARGRTPDGVNPVRPSPIDEAARRRQARADEAFVDGVLFAHYFDPFDRFGDDPRDVDPHADDHLDDDLDGHGWDDGWDDDGWDDDVFHDDAGDW